ncbi:MAG: type VI secretion system baseplate subunit TssF [Desulfovibrio desulfuricans]|jgi:type VI secretion system protein ImpG|nr:type VI secretion system baseplate subunit TssF [Desulfovibrio desulfuricans]
MSAYAHCAGEVEDRGKTVDKYYQEQLQRLREGAGEFARRYPAIAPMLLEESGDPDVERILEGTAWLCGKIHERLDQTAPGLVQSLLRLVFPQAILPVPSVTLVRFTPRQGFSEALDVPAGTQVASNPVDGVSCIFSTAHDLRVLPLSIVAVAGESPNASSTTVTVTLRSRAPLREILDDSLPLYLAGSYAAASQRFLALLTRCTGCAVSTGAQTISLPPQAVTQHALPLTDMRLPASSRSNRGYMELLRYFHFPEQLLALRVSGLRRCNFSSDDRELRLEFRLRGGGDTIPDFPDGCFALNVTPAANVFRVPAEPLVIDHTREEYLIRPQDGKQRFLEILGVESATALFPGGRTLACLPYEAYDETRRGLLYSLRHRRAEQDGAVEHLLTPLYRLENRETVPDRCTLSMDLLCCNHSLPGSLQVGDVCRPTDSSPAQAEFANITAPAPMLPRHADESLQWRFVSHMNANLLSLASAEALRSLLELYVPESGAAPELAAANQRRVQAVTAFSSGDEERLFRGRLLRGRLLRLTLDPAGFVSDGDLFLFASALERFFAEYANLNTYSRLQLKVGGTGESHQWPPRLGEKQLI